MRITLERRMQRDLLVGFVAPRLLPFIHEDETKAFDEDICMRVKDAGLGLASIDSSIVRDALGFLANLGWAASIPRKDGDKGPTRYRLTRDGAAQLSILFISDQPGISVRVI